MPIPSTATPVFHQARVRARLDGTSAMGAADEATAEEGDPVTGDVIVATFSV